MKRILLLALIATGCATNLNPTPQQLADLQQVEQVAAVGATYALDAGKIALALPSLKNDVFYVKGILASPNILNANEQAVVAADAQEVDAVIDGINNIYKASKDPANAVIAAAQIQHYVTTCRSVHDDIKAIIVAHSSQFSSAQLSNLNQIDAKLEMINEAYNDLVSRNTNATEVIQMIVESISTGLQLTQGYSK